MASCEDCKNYEPKDKEKYNKLRDGIQKVLSENCPGDDCSNCKLGPDIYNCPLIKARDAL